MTTRLLYHFPCPDCGRETRIIQQKRAVKVRQCYGCKVRFLTRTGDSAEHLTAYHVPGLRRDSDEYRQKMRIFHSLLNTLEMGVKMGRVSRLAIESLKRAGMKAGVEIL